MAKYIPARYKRVRDSMLDVGVPLAVANKYTRTLMDLNERRASGKLSDDDFGDAFYEEFYDPMYDDYNYDIHEDYEEPV